MNPPAAEAERIASEAKRLASLFTHADTACLARFVSGAGARRGDAAASDG